MTNRFMMSVAAVALIAGAGFANAQGTGTKEQPSAGSTAQQSAPSSERGNSAAEKSPSSGMKATQPEEKKSPSGMKATQSEEKSPGAAKNQRAQDEMKAGQKGEKSAQDNMKGEKSKSMSSENEGAKSGDIKSGKDMKAEGRDSKMNAEQKGAADSKSQTQTGQTTPPTQTGQTTSPSGQTTTQSQSGTSVQSQTTGQVGASAKLSADQRTKIVSTIREQHVQPVTNVNFELRPGVRVSRDVRFHPLPREVVTIYPEWRGYEFILVNDKIVVINPRTLEIVDILEV